MINDDTTGTPGSIKLDVSPLRLVPKAESSADPDSEPEPEDNVTSITFETVEKRGKWCLHMHQEYCREQRTITCKDCGASLDHFDAYMTIAQNYARLVVGIKHLKEEEAEIQKRVEDLKRIERNTKARIRKVDPNIDLDHEDGLDVAETEAEIDALFAKLGKPTWKTQCEAFWSHIRQLREQIHGITNTKTKRGKR